MRQNAERRAVPGNVYSMCTEARAHVAKEYGRRESAFLYDHVYFPFSSILTNDTTYSVSFIDGKTYSTHVVGTNQVTQYDTVSATITADGRIRADGISTHKSTAPARQQGKPRPDPTNVTEELPQLDLVQIARDTLTQELDADTLAHLIPFSCSFDYTREGEASSGIRYIWVHLFDPRDIQHTSNEDIDFVSGYMVLIRPDGTSLYRGRGRFGSSRFRDIYSHLHAAPRATAETL